MTKITQQDEQPKAVDIPIGISACVLGQEVRYNGGHKLDRFIRDTLGTYVRFVPVCPEVEIGLGIPRETLRLVRGDENNGAVRLVAPKSNTDHTVRLESYARKRTKELAKEDLCGYILQKGSPSCGMERVRIYDAKPGVAPARNGRGLYARELIERFPNLPVEEDGRLNDAGLRENFVERIFAYRRVRTLFGGRWRLGDLVAFHAREKLLLLAHDRPTYQELGRLVAATKERDRQQVASEYETLFLNGLRTMATRGKQTNVLQHIAGYFKKLIDSNDRQEIQEVIASYRAGHIPLVVPLTLLKHHVRRYGIEYLAQQTYLDLHPTELMLRNHG
ncbi:MAG: hypothetical protein A2289_11670 [Deltaproteobacteria bacterium RIFOXYA12_FULL_58_15]|nr:MAG: hypothetical protein A2289_11670 [Deltaproteobacteria bacterium RIFOXYA12_FULL_58_15]